MFRVLTIEIWGNEEKKEKTENMKKEENFFSSLSGYFLFYKREKYSKSVLIKKQQSGVTRALENKG